MRPTVASQPRPPTAAPAPGRPSRHPRRGALLWLRRMLLACWLPILAYAANSGWSLARLSPSALGDPSRVAPALLPAPLAGGAAPLWLGPVCALAFLMLLWLSTWATVDTFHDRRARRRVPMPERTAPLPLRHTGASAAAAAPPADVRPLDTPPDFADQPLPDTQATLDARDAGRLAAVRVATEPVVEDPPETATATAPAPSRSDEAATTSAFVPRIFLSHAGFDHAFASRLAEDLRSALGDEDAVWYDRTRPERESNRGLVGGDIWIQEIEYQLTSRNTFVVVLSPQALDSPWVRDEIYVAITQKNSPRRMLVVPVMLRTCTPPAFLGLIQSVPFESQPYERALDALLTAVREGKTREARREGEPPFDLDRLPTPPRFVGREDDLAWVVKRLRRGGTTGITAVNGMGGIGKTALAAVAVRVLYQEGAFPDGIGVVVCAGMTDPVEILRQVLTRFDPQRRQPEAADLDALAYEARRRFEGRHALVALDNVDPDDPQIGWKIEQVVRPLQVAGATVLLTSRQYLPESVVPVDASRRLNLLSEEEALDLFAQSYGKGEAATLTPAEREQARKIVELLDRHTLAVKLAGAYAAQLNRSLAELLADLQADPLKPPKDETPREVARVLGPSVQTLPSDAHRLFIALPAIATHEFGRQAALALASGLGIQHPEPTLELLVRRALLDASPNDTMPPGSDRERLRLHPLLRAYAEGERVPEEERERASAAVAEWYANYTNDAPDLALVQDEANITGALEWAHQQVRHELVADLCAGMRSFWRDRARPAVSIRCLPWGIVSVEHLLESKVDKGLDDAAGAEPKARFTKQTDRLFWFRLDYGYAFQITGRLDDAEQQYEQCLELAVRTAARRNEGAALNVLGQLARNRGRLVEAHDYYLRALTVAREVGNRSDEAVDLSELGQVAQRRGRLEEAEGYYQQSLAIRREVQDRQGEGVDLFQLALIAERRGDLDRAEALHRESLAIGVEVQSGPDVADYLLALGRFLIEHQRNPEEGCQMLREAVRLYAEMRLPGLANAVEAALRFRCMSIEDLRQLGIDVRESDEADDSADEG